MARFTRLRLAESIHPECASRQPSFQLEFTRRTVSIVPPIDVVDGSNMASDKELHMGGLLAVFSRSQVSGQEFAWLRAFADSAAVAIANARAFEEIEALKLQLELENEYLRDEIRTAHASGGIVGQSRGLQKVLKQVKLVAPTGTSVLILGESGVGKELIARARDRGSEAETEAHHRTATIRLAREYSRVAKRRGTLERQNLFAVLERAKWKISGAEGAAEFLGLHPATLISRMRAMGIKKPR